MSRFTRIPAVLFVIAVPLFLVTASVTWAVNDPKLYNRGFENYNISLTTGITDADLQQVGADLRHYFNSGDEPLVVRTRVFGVEQEIFNQREVRHMRDVKQLVRGVYAVAVGSGAYLLAMMVVGFMWQRRRFLATLARLCLWGGGLTLGLVLVVGLFALVGFETLFLKFHQFSFSNDFWKLDSRTDYLVIMFPEDFWFDATIFVATLAVGGAVALTAISSSYLLYRRRADQVSEEGAASKLEEASQA